MSNPNYRKRVEYDFHVIFKLKEGNIGWATATIKDIHKERDRSIHLQIGVTSKSGELLGEGVLMKYDSSGWRWDVEEIGLSLDYSQELVDAIRNYINEHGLPEEEI